MSSDQTRREAKRPRRKPYRSPKLVVYGDLRRLTRMIIGAKRGARMDGAMMTPQTRL